MTADEAGADEAGADRGGADRDGADEAIDDVIEDDAQASRRGRLGWLSLTVAILFGLFYAYDFFEAISNVVGVTAQINEYNAARGKVDLAPVPTPWALLIVDLLLAPVAYALAFFLGRRNSVFTKILIFSVGLTVVAALTLSVEALAAA